MLSVLARVLSVSSGLLVRPSYGGVGSVSILPPGYGLLPPVWAPPYFCLGVLDVSHESSLFA